MHTSRSAYNHLLCLAQSNGLPRTRIDAVLDQVGLTEAAKTRVGSVRQHLTLMNDQVENLFDANNMMGTVYAIMNESMSERVTIP